MKPAVAEPGGGSASDTVSDSATVSEPDGSRLAGPTGRPSPKMVLLALLCSAAWLASVLVGGFLDCGPDLHRIALACHILALVLSFGAILVLDWVGLLWLLGRRDVHDTRRLESAAQPLIWGGLALLLVSGAMMRPDLSSPLTPVKLLCVLVLILNGLALAQAMKQLHFLPPRTLFTKMATRLRVRLLVALCISQTCWWTSVLVGLLNSTLRRWTGA
ncbi:hypothetical protein [Pseudarthrobacter sp. S9]|uniref:hypothetical protein n=1 Tax=Pseudarthrobacter sp. S9 TaxID=3418421 RepID=UPI003D03E1FF